MEQKRELPGAAMLLVIGVVVAGVVMAASPKTVFSGVIEAREEAAKLQEKENRQTCIRVNRMLKKFEQDTGQYSPPRHCG